MSYVNILVEKKVNIGVIKINRPKYLNALNRDTIIELTKAVEELEKDKNIKVVLITGEGKAFIAGADIKQMNEMNPSEAKKFAEMGHKLLMKIEKSRLPFIAAINGYALGGGCEVLMACDIAIACASAKIGQPEINLGIHPGFGGTQRLPRIVGRSTAKYLLFTGEIIKADKALEMGLVDEVVEADKLIERCLEIAKTISSKGPVAVSLCKQAVNQGIELDLIRGENYEVEVFAETFATYDQKEGMKAFTEKREARFEGR